MQILGDVVHGQGAEARRRQLRQTAARVILGLALVVAAALVWLLIVGLWAAAAGRSVPPLA